MPWDTQRTTKLGETMSAAPHQKRADPAATLAPSVAELATSDTDQSARCVALILLQRCVHCVLDVDLRVCASTPPISRPALPSRTLSRWPRQQPSRTPTCGTLARRPMCTAFPSAAPSGTTHRKQHTGWQQQSKHPFKLQPNSSTLTSATPALRTDHTARALSSDAN